MWCANVVAVLEVELVLPALFGGDARDIAAGRCVAEDGGSERFVDEDTGAIVHRLRRRPL